MPTFIFLLLALVLSWYPWIAWLLGAGTHPGPNPLGLLVAAVVASLVAGGRPALKAWAARAVRFKAPPAVWAASLLIPLATAALATCIGRALGWVDFSLPVPWAELPDRFLIALLFVALGEEPAWRGFLQHHWQRTHTPLLATAGVAVVWAVWHLPLMGTEFAWEVVPAFVVSVAAGAVVLAWLFNASGESVPVCMLSHAFLNTIAAGVMFRWVAPASLPAFWSLYAGCWCAAAATVVYFVYARQPRVEMMNTSTAASASISTSE